jgi:NitT/TauT family transport system substrate-binding protein
MLDSRIVFSRPRTRWCIALSVWAVLVMFFPVRQSLAQVGLAESAELVETRTQVPRLKAAATCQVKDNVVEIELSEYAGYAGMIAANNGLEPNEDSYFFRNHNFKVKLTLSEEESWSALNSGKMAGSATTVDVIAAYGSQFKVTVPALIGFSRGATSIVVRKNIRKINDLKGKIIATCQFTEADFFIRYLASEAGLGLNQLADLDSTPDPEKINLVFCADGFASGDFFARDVKRGFDKLAGCVTWNPKTSEVIQGCGGDVLLLASTSNMLVVADILILNEGFARENPGIVEGLVDGLLAGNDMVRREPARHAKTISGAFGWEEAETLDELKKVHLANLPENIAFFDGTIDSAGSFGYLFETAAELYRPQLLEQPLAPREVYEMDALKTIQSSGRFRDQKASIEPIKLDIGLGEQTVRDKAESLLSKDIRIEFEPNRSEIMGDIAGNSEAIENILKLLQVAPGSTILLRGHADGVKLQEFKEGRDYKAAGGEERYRQGKLKLKALSWERCESTKDVLVSKYGIAADRIEIEGVGIDEPTGKGPDKDRRVEVRWFPVE